MYFHVSCPFSYLEHLEERRLSGVAAGGARGHHNVDGREGPHTGRGGHAVGLNHVADVTELAVGEDEPHVSHHTGEELQESVRGGQGGREGRQAGEETHERKHIAMRKTQKDHNLCSLVSARPISGGSLLEKHRCLTT